MNKSIGPKTYLAHPSHNKFRTLLEQLFLSPDTSELCKEVPTFLQSNPFPAADFPTVAESYSRTILYRAENKFECLAAHWSKGAVSKVHGHPEFSFVYIMSGKFLIENFKKDGPTKIIKTAQKVVGPGHYFSLNGTPDRFDNGIHKIMPQEEGLSIHIYSDNALLGEIFKEPQ